MKLLVRLEDWALALLFAALLGASAYYALTGTLSTALWCLTGCTGPVLARMSTVHRHWLERHYWL